MGLQDLFADLRELGRALLNPEPLPKAPTPEEQAAARQAQEAADELARQDCAAERRAAEEARKAAEHQARLDFAERVRREHPKEWGMLVADVACCLPEEGSGHAARFHMIRSTGEMRIAMAVYGKVDSQYSTPTHGIADLVLAELHKVPRGGIVEAVKTLEAAKADVSRVYEVGKRLDLLRPVHAAMCQAMSGAEIAVKPDDRDAAARLGDDIAFYDRMNAAARSADTLAKAPFQEWRFGQDIAPVALERRAEEALGYMLSRFPEEYLSGADAKPDGKPDDHGPPEPPVLERTRTRVSVDDLLREMEERLSRHHEIEERQRALVEATEKRLQQRRQEQTLERSRDPDLSR